ncbi:hypothetical protein [Exiguobacterium sp. s133]|uniref:hypothetical protein n=1 Tax=Exiguobacterium sp. s133 TaxID=2751213 RepID=UPI001BE75A35|nr:hypothetical protein [Exiguobacterium sp. s133]
MDIPAAKDVYDLENQCKGIQIKFSSKQLKAREINRILKEMSEATKYGEYKLRYYVTNEIHQKQKTLDKVIEKFKEKGFGVEFIPGNPNPPPFKAFVSGIINFTWESKKEKDFS